MASEVRGLAKTDPANPELKKLRRRIKLAWHLLKKSAAADRLKTEDATATHAASETVADSVAADLRDKTQPASVDAVAEDVKDSVPNASPTKLEPSTIEKHTAQETRKVENSSRAANPPKAVTEDNNKAPPRLDPKENVKDSLPSDAADKAVTATGASSVDEKENAANSTVEKAPKSETSTHNATHQQLSGNDHDIPPETTEGTVQTNESNRTPPEPDEEITALDSTYTLEAVEKAALEETERQLGTVSDLRVDPDSVDMEQSDLLQAYDEPDYQPKPRKPHAAPIREVNTSKSTERKQNLEHVEKLYELEALNEPGGLEELDESEVLSSLWELDSPEHLDGLDKQEASPGGDPDSLSTESLDDLVEEQEAEVPTPPLGPYHPSKRRVKDIFPTTFEDRKALEVKAPIKQWITLGTIVALLMVAVPILVVAYTKYFPSSPVDSLPFDVEPTPAKSPHPAQFVEPRPEQHDTVDAKAVKNVLPLPDMVNIPSGCATIGSHFLNEGPPRDICVGSFKMSRDEITFDLYDAFADLSVRARPDDRGWGRGNRPVINVSWHDAKAYADFVSAQTEQICRLPSEAEWEYAARALTTTSRFWGKEPVDACEFANAADLTAGKKYSDWLVHECDDGYLNTAPVASYRPNAFGLYDMLGNVSEWVEDCSHGGLEGAPKDGRPWMMEDQGDCDNRMTRGGSWRNPPFRVRSSSRGTLDVETRSDAVGFRVVCHPES